MKDRVILLLCAVALTHGVDYDGGNSPASDNGDNNNIGGGNCDPSEAPTICAAEDSDDVLVAHENCNEYYICDGGIPVARPCPKTLFFNPVTDQCDWPENVDCGDRVIPDPDDDCSGNENGGSENDGSDNDSSDSSGSDNDSSDSGGSDNDSSDSGGSDNDSSDSGGSDNGGNDVVGGGNCDPSEAPAICSADNSDDVLVAHENCNKYYICHDGKPVARPCPKNLLFNPITDQCDWPENVDCGDRVIPDPDDDDSGNDNGSSDNGGNDNDSSDNSGSDNDDNDNGGTCNCNPGEAPEICLADNSNGILIAHENCNQYYICDHGKPVAMPCPEKLLYNPYKEECDWPENVDCGDRVIPDPDNDNSDNGNDNDNGSDADNNQPINDDPSQAPSICADRDSDGVLVAHENCNQYYICSAGRPVAMPCPTGLLFNPVTWKCDWPQNVICGDRVTPDDDCACDPRNAPKLCSKQNSNGLLVAHENCNQFYMCVAGIPVPRPCPETLLFNADKTVCDWPQNVNCNSRLLPFASLNKHLESRQSLRK